MDAELKIKIGAETQQAEQGINKVTTALGKLKPSSNQATFALTNLSRVAQDAPFGFIGIANNINPLIDSFVALKKETGSVKGALGALVGGLSGGGGLILLTGLASAAMSIFGQSLQKAGKGSTDAADDLEKYQDAIKGIIEGVGKEASKVALIVDRLKEGNLSRKEQNELIKELKKISPDHFKNLDDEKTKVSDIVTAYNSYSDALIRNIELQVRQKDLTDVITARLDLLRNNPKADEALKKELASGKTLSDILSGSLKQGLDNLDAKRRAASGSALRELEAQDKINVKVAELAGLLTKEQAILNSINNITLKDLGVTITPEKGTKSKFDPNQFLKENLVGFNESVYKLDQEAQKAFGEVGKNAAAKLSETIGGNFNLESLATKIKEKLQLALNRAAELGIKLPDLSNFSGDLSRLQFVDATIGKFEELQKKAKETGETIVGALTPAFDGFFKALIDGSGNPFKALGDAFKQLIIQIGVAIVKTQLLKAINNGITSGGSGSGILKFLSSALSGNIGGTAGGINTGGITGSANFVGQKLVAEVSGTSLKFILDKTNGSVKRGF